MRSSWMAALTLSACVHRLTVVPVGPDRGPVGGAQVSVDGRVVGTGTTTLKFKRDAIISVAGGPEWVAQSRPVDRRTPARIEVMLPPDRLFLATVDDTNAIVNRWITMTISGRAASSWWTTVVNAVQTQGFEPELMDSASGFIRTAWLQNDDLKVRRRYVGNVVSQEPLVWRVRYEVQRLTDGSAEWQVYDRGFKDEIDAILEIRARTQ